jgi:hypothetical protein
MNLLAIIAIVSILVLIFGFLAISFHIYVFFSHEKEQIFPGSNYAMASIIISIFLSFIILLLLPIDFVTGDPFVNRNSIGLSVNNFGILNTIIYISIFTTLSNLFWLKYYRYHNPYNEDKEDIEIETRTKSAVIFIGKIILGIFIILIPASFIFGGRIVRPYLVKEYAPRILRFSDIQANTFNDDVSKYSYTLKISPDLNIIISGPFFFFGYLIFYIIGGFGMSTIPLNCFSAWIHRPRKPEAEHMVMGEMILREMTEENINTLKDLIETEEEIDEIRMDPNHDRVALRVKIDTLQSEIISVQKNLVLFEETFDLKNKNHNILNENPLKYLGMLILGFISGAFSILLYTSRPMARFFKTSPIEKIFFFAAHFNNLYALLLYMVLAFYSLYSIFRGFETLCYFFPKYLGYNQIQEKRTWMDSWLVLAIFMVPSAICVNSYFISICPNFFAFTENGITFKQFIFNLEYIYYTSHFMIFLMMFTCSFGLGIIWNFSKGISKDILTVRIEETKNKLKNNQLKFKKENNMGVKNHNIKQGRRSFSRRNSQI